MKLDRKKSSLAAKSVTENEPKVPEQPRAIEILSQIFPNSSKLDGYRSMSIVGFCPWIWVTFGRMFPKLCSTL